MSLLFHNTIWYLSIIALEKSLNTSEYNFPSSVNVILESSLKYSKRALRINSHYSNKILVLCWVIKSSSIWTLRKCHLYYSVPVLTFFSWLLCTSSVFQVCQFPCQLYIRSWLAVESSSCLLQFKMSKNFTDQSEDVACRSICRVQVVF